MGWKRKCKLHLEGFVEFREAEHMGLTEMKARYTNMHVWGGWGEEQEMEVCCLAIASLTR